MPGEVNPYVFAQPIVVPVGSATTPSMYFSSATSIGIYYSGNSVLNIFSGGTVVIGSVLSATTIVCTISAPSSVTSGALSTNQVFFNVGASGISIGVRSGGTTWWIESSVSTK